MRRTEPEGHGPVRYGPALPSDGLPVLPELAAVLAAAADRADGEPVGLRLMISTPALRARHLDNHYALQ
ncbi:hypothetical protein ACWCYC_44660, partial [Streptomyces phaeofaciens]